MNKVEIFIEKYFSKIILFLSLLILFYFIYKSEIVNSGNSRDYYYKYFVVSSILILSSVSTFFLNSESKKNLTIFLFSLYFSVVVVEIFLYLKFQPNIHELVKYNILKKKNSDTFLKVYPSFFLKKQDVKFFPLSGMSNKHIVVCKETSNVFTFNSDRYGFNNPDDEWNKEIVEFFIIGDSFAHGNCVEKNHSISANFRKLLKKKNNIKSSVLNTGQPATGPLIQLAILKEYLPENKKINNLLWFYYEQNDLQNLYNELKHPILFKYYNDKNFSQNLINYNEEKDLIVQNFHENHVRNIDQEIYNNYRISKYGVSGLLHNIIRLRNVRKLTIENDKIKKIFIKFIANESHKNEKNKYPNKPNLSEFEFEIDEQLLIKFKNIATEIKLIANKQKINAYFIYLPSLYRIENNKNTKFTNIDKQTYSASDNLFRHDTIKNIVRDLDFEVIDLNSTFFKDQINPENFFTRSYRSHFTVDGYKQISKFIYNFVDKYK